MTRVLIVQPDPTIARRMAADLRAAGYETELCGGPQQERCPVLEDLPCPAVDRADLLVYDAFVAGDGEDGHRLIAHLRDVYADLPVVLTSGDASLGWVEPVGPQRVFALGDRLDPAALRHAVETALNDQGMAV